MMCGGVEEGARGFDPPRRRARRAERVREVALRRRAHAVLPEAQEPRARREVRRVVVRPAVVEDGGEGGGRRFLRAERFAAQRICAVVAAAPAANAHQPLKQPMPSLAAAGPVHWNPPSGGDDTSIRQSSDSRRPSDPSTTACGRAGFGAAAAAAAVMAAFASLLPSIFVFASS